MTVPTKKYSISIIEDDIVSQFASRYCLEQFAQDAFTIYTFDSAYEALAAFGKFSEDDNAQPHIIFLDLGLHKMGGWEFIDELQKLLAGMRLPEIYILSAFANREDREKAENHPLVFEYFDKPLTKNRLGKIFEGRLV